MGHNTIISPVGWVSAQRVTQQRNLFGIRFVGSLSRCASNTCRCASCSSRSYLADPTYKASRLNGKQPLGAVCNSFWMRSLRGFSHPSLTLPRCGLRPAGEGWRGVSDIIDEPKFQFFNCLLPSPQPLSQRERGLSAEWQTASKGCLPFVLDAVATRLFTLHPALQGRGSCMAITRSSISRRSPRTGGRG